MFLFLTKKISSPSDIPSQSYIKNKINTKLLPHPLDKQLVAKKANKMK